MAVTLKKQAFYIRDGQEYTDPGIFISDVPAAVEAIGEQQRALVTAEGTTQVGNVQTKGQEVLNSIPQDYSALADEVDNLNSAVVGIVPQTFDLGTGTEGHYSGTVGSAVVINSAASTWIRYPVYDLSDYVGMPIQVAQKRVGVAVGVAFCDANGIIGTIFTENTAVTGQPRTYIVDSTYKYMYASVQVESLSYFSVVYEGAPVVLERKIAKNESEITLIEGNTIDTSGITRESGSYSGTAGNTIQTISGGQRFTVDLASFVGNKVKVTETWANTTRSVAMCNSSGVIQAIYPQSAATYEGFVFDITEDYHVLYVSEGVGYPCEIKILDGYLDNIESHEKVIYVSPSGNQWNSGLLPDYPIASVNKALEIGATKIGLAGGVYSERINLDKTKNRTLTFFASDPYNRPIFVADNSLVATTSTLVSGHVYSADFSAPNTNYYFQNWIFQEDVADTTTQISASERHPLERGLTYRCDDTCIRACSAANVSDAITEIESAYSDGVYKFYQDKENGKVYFSSPEAVSSTHPLRAALGNTNDFIQNAVTSNKTLTTKRGVTLNFYGITVKYMPLNVSDTTGSKVVDCRVFGSNGTGGFVYDRCVGVTFERCEAARTIRTASGDGFNGHSDLTGEAFAKQTTCTLIDCWAHDNNDDGYSDHERSETTVIGGLYEYNGKAGITPALGSHCTCYNVYSRNNFNGFYYVESAADGGVGGQIVCYNCIAENNTDPNTGAGFAVKDTGNKAILIGCKSIGNRYGYRAYANTQMILIDCTAADNNTATSGTLTVKNTTAITG